MRERNYSGIGGGTSETGFTTVKRYHSMFGGNGARPATVDAVEKTVPVTVPEPAEAAKRAVDAVKVHVAPVAKADAQAPQFGASVLAAIMAESSRQRDKHMPLAAGAFD